jgi:hypothetical protein
MLKLPRKLSPEMGLTRNVQRSGYCTRIVRDGAFLKGQIPKRWQRFATMSFTRRPSGCIVRALFHQSKTGIGGLL